MDEQIIPLSQNSPSDKEIVDAIIQLQRIISAIQQQLQQQS
jgi:hypothetical protein